MRSVRTPAPPRGRARFAGLVLLAGSGVAWAQSAALAVGSAGAAPASAIAAGPGIAPAARVSGELKNPASAGETAPASAAAGFPLVAAIAPPDFPDVEVLRKAPGRAPGLLLVTPYYSAPGQAGPVGFLAIIDDDGAVHFQRRVSPAAHNFRWHEHAGRYSYNEAPPNGAGDVVLLDERLDEVGRVRPVAGLAPAMMHEFLITDEGNYLFVVNQPAMRDLGRYLTPADARPQPSGAEPTGTGLSNAAPPNSIPSSAERSDADPINAAPSRAAPSNSASSNPDPSTAEPVFDSIIQEVSPEGREVFRWNAWEHLKLSDCLWSLFPCEYAKLNSLQLSGGDLIASFRGCSTVLKIERPSGRVLWQLGGSDPAAPRSGAWAPCRSKASSATASPSTAAC